MHPGNKHAGPLDAGPAQWLTEKGMAAARDGDLDSLQVLLAQGFDVASLDK